jgi:hypothetical protein
MPSFSKEFFGGFVEFQRVAIDPNQKVIFFQIFYRRTGSDGPLRAQSDWGKSVTALKRR